MTHAECVAALQRYEHRAVVLALVHQIRPEVMAKALPEHHEVCRTALDTAERRALGRATQEECRKAADAAYAATDAAYAATDAATYAATDAAAYAAASAAASAADAKARARLVSALRHAPAVNAPQWLVVGDAVLSGSSVWTGSEWVQYGAQGPELSVQFDAALEAA